MTPNERRYLTTAEMCRVVGITYRQAYYWMQRGYIEPVRPAKGSGISLEWDLVAVERAKLIKERFASLRSAGIPAGDAHLKVGTL